MNNYMIDKKNFTKDHWNLLLYIKNRCLNNKGFLEKNKLRINNKDIQNKLIQEEWNPKNGTVIKIIENNKILIKQLPEHDDLDCLDDFENAGYIKIISNERTDNEQINENIILSGYSIIVSLTKQGYATTYALTKHLKENKSLNDFIG